MKRNSIIFAAPMAVLLILHSCACSREEGPGGNGAAGGAGGVSGTGGEGGREVVEDFDDPKIPGWLLDSSIWTLAPQRELWDSDCLLFEGRSDRLQFPILEWKSCGDGCEHADLVQGFVNENGFNAGYPVFGMAHRRGEDVPVVQLSNYLDGAVRTIAATRIIDLESGVTLGALKASTPVNARVAYCVSTPPSGLSVEIGRLLGDLRTEYTLYDATAFFHPDSASWRWRLPFQRFRALYDCTQLSMDGDDGKAFWVCPGGLVGQIQPASSETTLLVEADSKWSMWRAPAATSGNRIIWSEDDFPSAGRIRSWSTDGQGATTILDQAPVETCELSMDERTIVGVFNENRRPCNIAPATYRFWWVPRGEERISSSEPISAEPVTSYGLTSRGDHAAAQIYRDLVRADRSPIERTDRVRIILIRLSDQSMRQFRPPPEMDFLAYFLSSKHLYVMYQPAVDANMAGSTEGVFRFDLEKFDRIGLAHDGTLE